MRSWADKFGTDYVSSDECVNAAMKKHITIGGIWGCGMLRAAKRGLRPSNLTSDTAYIIGSEF